MRFVIDAPHLQSGLRVIPEIPNYEICRLEGRNGIGKTLAVHLLELATGQQPFARQPAAWRSLQSGLGIATVRIENIPDSPDIVVRLDPTQWNPALPVDPRVTIGDAQANGNELSLDEVGRIVRVIRISADETLEDAVAGLLQDDLLATQRIVSDVARRRTTISMELSVINEALAPVLPEKLAAEESRLSDLTGKLDDDLRQLDRAHERQAQLATAQALSEQLAATQQSLPELENERHQVNASIKEMEAARVVLDHRRLELEPLVTTEKAIAEEIAKAQRLRSIRARRLLEIEKSVAPLVEAAGVPARAPDLSQAISECETGIARLKERIAAIDSEGFVAGIMDQMQTPLDGARLRGFGNEVIARFDDRYERVFGRAADVTVNDLIAGLGRQRVVLSQRKRSVELEGFRKELTMQQVRLDQVRRLGDLAVKRKRAMELLKEADLALEQLSARAAGAQADEYRAAISQMAAIDSQLRDLAIKDVELVHRMEMISGGQTAEQIKNRLTAAVARLNVAPSELLEVTRQHQGRVAELDRIVAATSAELNDARLMVDALTSQLRPVLLDLAGNPSLTWLGTTIDQELHIAGDDPEALSNFVGRLHRASQKVEAYLGMVVNDLQALHEALGDLVRVVSRRDTAAPPPDLIPRLYAIEVQGVFSDRLRREFSQREVSEAVFDSGEVLAVDLNHLEITWRTPGGDTLTRPFEAFSSGERAFAYTRARVEAIGSVPAAHRVIVIDEFGAFLASDRLDTLVRYLHDAVVGKVAAQVVLILPLSIEDGDLAVHGESRQRQTRALDLERQHYFAEDALGVG